MIVIVRPYFGCQSVFCCYFRTRMFKHPMGSTKMCPSIKLQEMDNCLGLINQCDENDVADVCVTTPWSNWSPCSATCGMC